MTTRRAVTHLCRHGHSDGARSSTGCFWSSLTRKPDGEGSGSGRDRLPRLSRRCRTADGHGQTRQSARRGRLRFGPLAPAVPGLFRERRRSRNAAWPPGLHRLPRGRRCQRTAQDAHRGLTDATATCSNCHAGSSTPRNQPAQDAERDGAGTAPARTRIQGRARCHLSGRPIAPPATPPAEIVTCQPPRAVGGGLIKGHAFLRRAPMEDSCALCHGSRAGGEYLGQFDGIAPDVHFEAGNALPRLPHQRPARRRAPLSVPLAGRGRAQCTDCHDRSAGEPVPAHGEMHAEVACQVCHSPALPELFRLPHRRRGRRLFPPGRERRK